MVKGIYKFFIFFFLFSGKISFAAQDISPLAITSFSGGSTYCQGRASAHLSVSFSTTACGAGGVTNIPITVTWYSNVVNSTVGGTVVNTVNSTAATTTYIFVPPTTAVGTLYYYVVISWAAGANCALAGSLTTASTVAVTVNACAPSADLPVPAANFRTVPAGSLVIPMDNSHQNLWLTYPFNIKAYGLVNALLQNDIPVMWVIKSGKQKDSSDFSAVASRVYPTALPASLQYFKASEFIIDTTWLNRSYYSGGQTATQIISTFANQWKVAVYKLSANTSVDVRYDLNQRPKIACFNNGGFQQVNTKMLDSAQISNYTAISAGLFSGLAQCYTFCSEMHWSIGTQAADSATMRPVWDFVMQGGNFLAQCAGENKYENQMEIPRHFLTTNGTTQHNPAPLPTNTYSNPDMAFNQFEGTVAPRAGTTADWNLAAASAFTTEAYNCITSVTEDTIVAAATHFGSPDSVGGNVFYLGGHDYMTAAGGSTAVDEIGNLTYINGTRMYLNAALIPSHRPTSFVASAGSNQTICVGQSVTIGGSPTGPTGASYSWSPGTGLNNSASANPIATPTDTTAYSVFVDNGGCPGVSTVTVVVNPALSTTITSSNVFCFGGSNGTGT
ncbi:MAG TPA: hypothetical protein VII99_00915, partial [Bacteroidia bacterium]